MHRWRGLTVGHLATAWGSHRDGGLCDMAISRWACGAFSRGGARSWCAMATGRLAMAGLAAGMLGAGVRRLRGRWRRRAAVGARGHWAATYRWQAAPEQANVACAARMTLVPWDARSEGVAADVRLPFPAGASMPLWRGFRGAAGRRQRRWWWQARGDLHHGPTISAGSLGDDDACGHRFPCWGIVIPFSIVFQG